MGFSVAMMGRVGEDATGEFLLRELGAVDGRYVRRAGVSGRVYILLDDAGERRNFVWPGANDEFDVKDLPRHVPTTRYLRPPRRQELHPLSQARLVRVRHRE
jgi:sugar/nucleoside kinase (ribokinase family)